jgi:hypothetical protein
VFEQMLAKSFSFSSEGGVDFFSPLLPVSSVVAETSLADNLACENRGAVILHPIKRIKSVPITTRKKVYRLKNALIT